MRVHSDEQRGPLARARRDRTPTFCSPVSKTVAVGAVVAKLALEGATPAERAIGTCLVVTSLDGLDSWKALSRRHPNVRLGLECFETFEDEFLTVLVENGTVTEMDRHRVVPGEWSSFHDEDGEPLDDDLLRAAAESVAAQRLGHDVGTLSGGLDIALTMAKALGRVCDRVEPTMFGDPRRDALDAVIELAVWALWISTSATSTGPAESEFDHALQLTRSVVHAGRSELRDQPGEASWSEWLQIMIGSASDVIDAACHCWFEAETEGHVLGAEHYGTPTEQLELAARSLLTTCLQALALFDHAARSSGDGG